MSRRRVDGRVVTALIAAALLIAAYAAATSAAASLYRYNVRQSTTYSSAPNGFAVLFRYLTELGYGPVRLESFEELPDAGTVVIAADVPLERMVTRQESDRLAEWVRSGGRLVVVGLYAREALEGMRLSASATRGSGAEMAPSLPSRYALAGERMAPGDERIIVSDTTWASVYGDINGSVVLARREGDGEVVWLADVYPISNEGIGEAENGTFAVRLLAGGPLYFDEYHHGFVREGGVWKRMGSGSRAAVLLGALAVAVVLAAHGRRLGAPIPVESVPEARTVAYIESLAVLYRTAGARAEALGALAGGVERLLARRHGSLALGVKRNPTVAETLEDARALVARGRVTRDEFVEMARRIGRARREVEGVDE